jgi:hypothetical protein
LKPVPEPAAALALMPGAVVMMWGRIRRRAGG